MIPENKVVWSRVVHTGFAVTDLDRSVGWYTGVLGLELIARQRSESAYIAQIVGMKEAVLDIAFLGLPGAAQACEQVLELIEYRNPAGRTIDLRTNNVGVGHVALAVENLLDCYEVWLAAGADFVNPPVEIDRGANQGSWACYLRDPDGITVELMQPPSRRRKSV